MLTENFDSVNFEFWQGKAADLDAGEPVDQIMLLDDTFSLYSNSEVATMMATLDEVATRTANHRSTGARPFRNAVELGAGGGRVTPSLALRADSLTAVEFMPAFTARNEARCAEQGVTNVTFITADVRAEGVLPSSVDLAFVKWILMCLPDDDAKKLLANLVGRLRPGGVIFLNETCTPGGTTVEFQQTYMNHTYVAFYRPASWYEEQLRIIGGGTLTTTTVLDEAVYVAELGEANRQPIFLYVKDA
jgi:ubiquinone/menaquinone biosynthesis C-methylase UbiE